MPQYLLAVMPGLVPLVLVVTVTVWAALAARAPRPTGDEWRRPRPILPPVPHPRTRTSLVQPMTVLMMLVRLLFTAFAITFLWMGARAYEGDTEGPGLWLPLIYVALGGVILWKATVPLVTDIFDGRHQETVVGTVIDRREHTFTTGNSESLWEVTRHFITVREDSGFQREYMVFEDLWKRAERAARIRLVVATRSGYVYHSDVAPYEINPVIPEPGA